MSIPKFTNPYFVAASTQTCSRKDIFGDANSLKTSSEEDATGLDEELRWLEDCLRGSFFSHVECGKGEEILERPRKRRRKTIEPKDAHEELSVFEFRLLSSDEQPRKINVQPKPPKAIRAIEPEYEDTPEQAELREKRAREVAVDFDWVMKQSRLSFPTHRADRKKHELLALLVSSPTSSSSSSSVSLASSNILITERLKVQTNSASSTLPSKLLKHASPSPHELKKHPYCPLLPVHPSQTSEYGEGSTREKKRERGAPLPRRRQLKGPN